MTTGLSVPHFRCSAGDNRYDTPTLNGSPALDSASANSPADLLATAATLIEHRGLPVVPCNGKCPCDDKGFPLKSWQSEPISVARVKAGLSNAQEPAIGLIFGPQSGIIDIEADSPAEELLFAKLFEGVQIPTTPSYKSARGKHFLFRWDSRLGASGKGIVNYRNGTKDKLGIRLGTGDKGAQSIIPPSPGREWLVSLDNADPAPLPDAVIERIIAAAQEKTSGPARSPSASAHDRALQAMRTSTKSMEDTADGSNRLFTVACRAVEWNLDDDTAVATIRAYESGNPFPRSYVDADILARIRDAESKVTRGSAAKHYSNTDAGNAQRFADQHGQDVRYCHSWGKWLVWDGRRWAVDDSGEIMRRAKETARSIYGEASKATDKDDAKKLGQWAITSEGSGRLEATIRLARSELPILVRALDAHPWLLNCVNGAVDLRTGKLREHQRGDYLTKLCPVEYPGDTADAPERFLEFLNRIFDGNERLIRFVQRLLGMSLVGEVQEHALPIFFGTGSNGKTTLLETWSNLLGGDYAMKAPHGFLMASRNERHPTELADLQGKRFVYVMETDDGGRLSESLVKELTGGDTIRARRMKEDFWEFRPSHTMLLATNHKPGVRGTDHAIWRRLKLVPFAVTIPDSEQDKQLPAKLREEWSAILKWAVTGCLEWQLHGLEAPDEIASATQQFRNDSDVLGGFLEECCVVGQAAKVQSSELYAAYKDWAKSRYEYAAKQREFNQRLEERGFKSRKTGGVMTFIGIGLRYVGPNHQNTED